MNLTQLRAGYAALNAPDWVGDLPFPLFEGVSLKVRRAFTADWVDLVGKLRAEKTDLSEDENERRIERECLARVALSDWQGIDDAYTPDLAISLLADPDVGPAFRGCVWHAIGKREDAVKAATDAAEKN